MACFATTDFTAAALTICLPLYYYRERIPGRFHKPRAKDAV